MAKSPSFNTLRKREFDARLEEAGFCRGKKIWYRRAGDQIHGIDLQRFRSGSEYTFNLMFHYQFLPSVWKFGELDPETAVEVDFILFTRLGVFVIDAGEPTLDWGDVITGCDKWWDVDLPPEAQAARLKLCAEKCISVFDQYAFK